MALTLEDLLGKPKKLSFPLVAGKPNLTVWYYPNNFTAELESEVLAMQGTEPEDEPKAAKEPGANRPIRILTMILTKWDLPTPCTPEGMRKVPIEQLYKIITAVMGDTSPEETAAATSEGS